MQQVGQESQFWSGAPVAPAPNRASATAASEKPGRPASARHSRLKGPRLRALCVAAAALSGAIIYTVMTDGGRNARTSDPIMPTVETAAAAIGFGLDQVSTSGQKYTPDADIYEALDLDNVRSFATLDAESAKARIEGLPWIDKAELVRVYPGRLDIKVTERKPWAVWHNAKRDLLIDATGRILAAVKGSTGSGLMRISGEGAAKEAPALMAILARYPDIKRDLHEAERVAERRWTLKLNRNMTLILPPDREAQALAMYASDRSVKAISANGGYAVDLRAVNKITLRKQTGATDNTSAASDTQAKS